MMTTPHDTFREQLLDLAYGELAGREARTLRVHLETCAECRAELARMNATRSAMSGLGTAPAPERGESLLLDAAREAARARARKPLLPSWVWGASIGAAAIAAVAVLTLKLAPGVRSPLSDPDPRELVGSSPPAPPPAPAQSPSAPAEPPPALARGDEDGAARDTLADKKVKPARTAPEKRRGPSELREEGKVALGEKSEDARRSASGAGELGKAGNGLSAEGDDRFAAAPPPAAQPETRAPSPVLKKEMAARSAEGPSSATPAPAKPAAPSAQAPGAAAEAEAESDEAPAERVARAKQLAPQTDAGSGATLGRAPEDAVARHARLSIAGELRAATRAFPDCPGEASRAVESDGAGRVVKVTRRGAAAGKPYVLEQFYGEDGALAAVRWSSDGRVQELRLGPGSPTGAVAAVPASALEPRRAADAGPDAPPRCGG